jgi:hypothetical protein
MNWATKSNFSFNFYAFIIIIRLILNQGWSALFQLHQLWTREVIIITRQYCNYNPLYSLAPSKIITSKRRDQPSTYVYVALFNLGKTTLFIVTTTLSTVNSFKVVNARQLRIPHNLRKCLARLEPDCLKFRFRVHYTLNFYTYIKKIF